MSKSSLSKFVAATIAFITGDTDTTTALKNERLAKAAIKGQLSALEGALVNAEVKVESSREILEKKIYPVAQIKDQQTYYNEIIEAQKALNAAEKELADIEASISYAQNLLDTRF